MACSSGNTTTTMTSSGSEGDDHVQKHVIVDERKRKRMLSNRESARRSRARKQQHLDDLTAEIAQLRTENNQVLQTINLTTQQFLNIESENSVLRAQMNELSQRLQSLNEIANYRNTLNDVGSVEESMGYFGHGVGDLYGIMNGYNGNFTHASVNPWNLDYLNQPTIASNDVLLY